MLDSEKYIKAQDYDYETALREVEQGEKKSHWIWYIFPQIAGLGMSSTSEYYAIKNLDEAKEYLNHPVLGKRLIEITEKLLENDGDVRKIFGYPDYMKVRSCMTLFREADSSVDVFQKVLDKFYNGNADNQTLTIINR